MANDSRKLFYESFHFKSFTSNQWLKMWREGLEREYEKLYGFDVKIYVNRRTKPDKDIDMMSILMNTSLVMGQDINHVISKSRKREFVDVRKTACMILMDADHEPMEIERQLPIRNRIIYSYRTKMEDRFMTEPGYENKYEDIKKKVMDLSFPQKSES